MRGGAPEVTCAFARSVSEEPHVSLVVDQAPTHVVPPGPTQVLKGFIATPVLQDTMFRIFIYFDLLAQAVMVNLILFTSQTRGGALTLAIHPRSKPLLYFRLQKFRLFYQLERVSLLL